MTGDVPEELKIARIHWLDHHAIPGWHRLEDIKAVGYKVESVGWLVMENEAVIVLATSIGEGKASDFLLIMKSCIEERFEL